MSSGFSESGINRLWDAAIRQQQLDAPDLIGYADYTSHDGKKDLARSARKVAERAWYPDDDKAVALASEMLRTINSIAEDKESDIEEGLAKIRDDEDGQAMCEAAGRRAEVALDKALGSFLEQVKG